MFFSTPFFIARQKYINFEKQILEFFSILKTNIIYSSLK